MKIKNQEWLKFYTESKVTVYLKCKERWFYVQTVYESGLKKIQIHIYVKYFFNDKRTF